MSSIAEHEALVEGSGVVRSHDGAPPLNGAGAARHKRDQRFALKLAYSAVGLTILGVAACYVTERDTVLGPNPANAQHAVTLHRQPIPF